MPRFVLLIVWAALSATLTPAFSQSAPSAPPVPTIKKVPIKPTSPISGKEMYSTYCAVCHGADGRGSGPAAAALKSVPTDLTMLSHRNGGKFPESRVVSVLSFGTGTTAHGSAEMPIWGDLLGSMHRGSSHSIVQQRMHNIVDYLKTLQDEGSHVPD